MDKKQAKVVITARVDQEIKKKLATIAKKQKRTVSHVAANILTNHFGFFK